MILVITLMSVAHAENTAADETVRAASLDLFSSISKRNLAGVSSYLAPEGFTEFLPESDKLLKLDANAFSALFKSGAQIDLRLVDVQVKTMGSAAIVTGTRLGSITKPGASVMDGKSFITMVWFSNDGKWQLQHIHLSAASSNK